MQVHLQRLPLHRQALHRFLKGLAGCNTIKKAYLFYNSYDLWTCLFKGSINNLYSYEIEVRL